jgi:glycosyltransferase involved in cell wall biosynthesis
MLPLLRLRQWYTETMYVAIDARMILPEMTGVGRYLLGLGKALAELSNEEALETDRFDMWLQNGLPANHPARSLASGRLHIRELPFPHMSPRAQWRLPIELAHRRPDLLHYPHFDLPAAVTGKVVATIHDLKYILHPEFFPEVGSLKRLVIRTMTSFTARRARRVIVDSEYTGRVLAQRLGIPITKIRPIPLAVGKRYFLAAPSTSIQAVRQRFGLDDPFILFVGERRPHKNIEGALQAFAYFRRMTDQTSLGAKQGVHSLRPYKLVIAGKPYAGYHAPEQTAQRMGLGDAVSFIDYVPEEDLMLLYQAAEALLLLSYYEGFGLPVLEAMACGCPVVASNVTSLPEVTGEAGLLVPPSEPEQAARALSQVIAGGELRQQCIQRGLERARSFTWEACARRTLEVYREVAEL